MSLVSGARHVSLRDNSGEVTSLTRSGRLNSNRFSYGTGGRTRSETLSNESITLSGSQEGMGCQSIGFDRGYSLTCIILHEAMYSAAFYILVPAVFLMIDVDGPLRYTEYQAVVFILALAGISFFLPLFGGIIGDTILGRYKAVLYGSVISFIGMVILLVYTVLVFVHNTTGYKLSLPLAASLYIIPLILIALGTGFVKANVTILGAGQLNDTADRAQNIQSYYRWYVFAINLGRLVALCPIAMFLLNYRPIPLSRPDQCPTQSPNSSNNSAYIIGTAQPMLPADVHHKGILAIVASVLQVVFVGLGIFIFMMGKAKYKKLDPIRGKHVFDVFCSKRFQQRIREFAPYSEEHQEYQCQMLIYKRAVMRVTLLMAAVLSMYTIYEALSYQKISVFMLQFIRLRQPAGLSVPLPVTFMNTFSALVLVVMVPVLEFCIKGQDRPVDVKDAEIDAIIKKWLEMDESNERAAPSRNVHRASIIKLFGSRRLPSTNMSNRFSADELNQRVRRRIARDIASTKHRRVLLIRMGIGLVCAALAALCAAILELMRRKIEGLSVFWQVPQYVIMGIGEIGEIAAYEFASTESLQGIQGLTMGMFISSYGLGSFLAYFAYAGASGSLTNPRDLNCFQMKDVYFAHFGLLVLIIVAFVILARQYHLEYPGKLEEPKCPFSIHEDNEDEDSEQRAM